MTSESGTSVPTNRLSGPDILAFLTAGPIHVFDPDSLDPVAEVTYRTDGSVGMKTTDGTTDAGAWGVTGDLYWTRYQRFRDGKRHEFYLEIVDDQTMQAHFGNGERAFLQSHKALLKPEQR